MKNFKTYTITIGAVITVSFFAFLLNTSQAKQGSFESKKIKISSQAEKERARKYFTDTILVNQHDKKVRFYTDVLEGHVVMLNVMYSSCKGSCPLMTKLLTHVKAKLGTRFGKDIYFASISNDPERDTPSALTRFAIKQHAVDKGWSFLTGKKHNVEKIVKKMGFYNKNFEEHSALLVAGNARTGHWIKIKPSTPLAGIVIKLNQLADEG